MPEFSYKAVNKSGKATQGYIDAESTTEALRKLRAQGLTPLKVVEAGETATSRADRPSPSPGEALLPRPRGLGAMDVLRFTSELAVTLKAGLPIDRALKVQESMASKPQMKALLQDLLKSVKSGKGLSDAMGAYHGLFGDFYLNMIRSGETGGYLADVLVRLSEHLERVRAMRESVVSALIYPAILICVAMLSVFIMLAVVVPKFESLFNDMGSALPLPTQVLLAVGSFSSEWWWLILISVYGLIVLVRRWLRGSAGKAWSDRNILKIPVLGSVVQKYEVTRFARSMGTLLSNGVTIVTALRIASDTIGNSIMREVMKDVPSSIKQGGRLADALEKTGVFTPLTLNMVRLGEETGSLDKMLHEVARVHDGEVQSGIKRSLTLIEPLLILVMGGAIAAIIISILLGIISVNDLAV